MTTYSQRYDTHARRVEALILATLSGYAALGLSRDEALRRAREAAREAEGRWWEDWRR